MPTLLAETPSSAKRPPDKKVGDAKGAEPGELLTGQTDPGLTLSARFTGRSTLPGRRGQSWKKHPSVG